MPAHVILSAERIRLDANPGSKDEAIRQAAQLLVDTGAIVAAGVVKANGQKACVTITNGILAGPGVPGKLQLSQ